MKKRSLIIGMGIGQLYKTVLENLGHEVITVDKDISKGAMLSSVDSAILVYAPFDTVHICTPNFTHFEIAGKVAPVSKIVFIEKPGVASSATWTKLVTEFKQTRFMMVKNNMWRSNINELKELASQAKNVKIRWVRRNCIPSPGSWFTTKKLAFGGVSRDLMPHLLSLYIAMNPKWKNEEVGGEMAMQCWELADIESTDYGTVNPNGTYDVDDMCVINFGHKWRCAANWRSMDEEDSSITFTMPDDRVERFELGWCPEDAYESMIKDAITHIDDYQFWLDQYDIDTWIHERIEKL
jgi:predicted dehydrogenase